MVFDSGYDLTRLAWLLRDLPVEVAGRLRSDRVMYFPAPARLSRPAGVEALYNRLADEEQLADPNLARSLEQMRQGEYVVRRRPAG